MVKTIRELLRHAPSIVKATAHYKIEKVLRDEQIVLGEVYAPDVIDAHGHFMTASELRKTAHRFMADGLLTSIDVQHDNELVDAVIVESFIARKGDPDFREGSWVAATKINDKDVWKQVKDGKLNGYSFEIMTYREKADVTIEYASWYYGFTEPDSYDKHVHPFLVRMDNNGEIQWGKTGLGSDGSPAHTISKTSVTDPVAGKTHRYNMR
jgi:hypothetical protein